MDLSWSWRRRKSLLYPEVWDSWEAVTPPPLLPLPPNAFWKYRCSFRLMPLCSIWSRSVLCVRCRRSLWPCHDTSGWWVGSTPLRFQLFFLIFLVFQYWCVSLWEVFGSFLSLRTKDWGLFGIDIQRSYHSMWHQYHC